MNVVQEPPERWRGGAPQVGGTPERTAHLEIWPPQSNITRSSNGGGDAVHEPPLTF